MNYLEMLNARRRTQNRARTGSGKKDGEGKRTFHPRKLYRGLTVPWCDAPGRKRIHPKEGRKE